MKQNKTKQTKIKQSKEITNHMTNKNLFHKDIIPNNAKN